MAVTGPDFISLQVRDLALMELFYSSGLRLAWNDAGAMRTAMDGAERLSVLR